MKREMIKINIIESIYMKTTNIFSRMNVQKMPLQMFIELQLGETTSPGL